MLSPIPITRRPSFGTRRLFITVWPRRSFASKRKTKFKHMVCAPSPPCKGSRGIVHEVGVCAGGFRYANLLYYWLISCSCGRMTLKCGHDVRCMSMSVPLVFFIWHKRTNCIKNTSLSRLFCVCRTNVSLQIDVLLNKSSNSNDLNANGVFLASNVDNGGCDTNQAHGVFLWALADSRVARLTLDAGMTTGFSWIVKDS